MSNKSGKYENRIYINPFSDFSDCQKQNTETHIERPTYSSEIQKPRKVQHLHISTRQQFNFRNYKNLDMSNIQNAFHSVHCSKTKVHAESCLKHVFTNMY